MIKEEFNNLDFMEQLAHVNTELQKGLTLNTIANSLEMSKTTIRERFKKQGYIYDKEQRVYIQDDKSMTSSIINDDKGMTRVTSNKKVDDKSMTRVINKDPKVNVSINKSDQEKLIYLFDNFDKLKNLIKSGDNSMTRVINIDVEEETDFNFRTTVRVNNVVWNRFKEFADKHKEFKQKDLLSQAISEFLNKYE